MTREAPIEVWQADVSARRPRADAGRAVLRAVLARYLGCAPAEIVFERGPYGKPAVAGGPHFSFSASGGLALVAVSRARPVGVDVERIDSRRPVQRIARSRFAEAERAALASCAPRERQVAFHRCWTAKEAYAKGLGRGLGLGLDRFSVAGVLAPGRAPVEHPCDANGPWEVEPIAVSPGYAAAVAAAGTGWRASLRIHGRSGAAHV